MRSRRHYLGFAVAFLAVLAVGGVASANHTSNVSSLPAFSFAPKDLPNNTTFKAGQLTVRTHTNYSHPGDKARGGFAKTVTLLFDNDLRVNLSGIPSCTATFGSSTTIAQAWERCGPGADTAPEVNAYLSPPGAVSGRASTAPPSNFNACTLVFKRSNSPLRLLLFSRVTLVANGTANCSNPATNSSGNTSVTLVGNLSNISAADFRTKLVVPGIDQLALPLDDFLARIKRGGAFAARCRDANKLLNLRGTFVYSGSGQPADTVNKTFGCL
jgi:hypothetical protein